MSAIQAQQLIGYAANLGDEQMHTLAGHASFTVQALPTGLEITPTSTGRSRFVSSQKLQEVLDEYEVSRSLIPAHYQNVTFDASYILALISGFDAVQRG